MSKRKRFSRKHPEPGDIGVHPIFVRKFSARVSFHAKDERFSGSCKIAFILIKLQDSDLEKSPVSSRTAIL